MGGRASRFLHLRRPWPSIVGGSAHLSRPSWVVTQGGAPLFWVPVSGLHTALGTRVVTEPVLGEGSVQSPWLALVGVGGRWRLLWISSFFGFLQGMAPSWPLLHPKWTESKAHLETVSGWKVLAVRTGHWAMALPCPQQVPLAFEPGAMCLCLCSYIKPGRQGVGTGRESYEGA